MTDIVDPQTRCRMMAGIRSQDTRPERLVRSVLHARGFRFRLHCSDLPGSPDLVLAKYRTCIFVHGCFWHHHAGCRYAATPTNRSEFWKNKLARTVARDEHAISSLLGMGWRVLVIWECHTRRAELLEALPDDFTTWLSGPSPAGALTGRTGIEALVSCSQD